MTYSKINHKENDDKPRSEGTQSKNEKRVSMQADTRPGDDPGMPGPSHAARMHMLRHEIQHCTRGPKAGAQSTAIRISRWSTVGQQVQAAPVWGYTSTRIQLGTFWTKGLRILCQSGK